METEGSVVVGVVAELDGDGEKVGDDDEGPAVSGGGVFPIEAVVDSLCSDEVRGCSFTDSTGGRRRR